MLKGLSMTQAKTLVGHDTESDAAPPDDKEEDFLQLPKKMGSGSKLMSQRLMDDFRKQ